MKSKLSVDDISRDLAKGMAVRMEQHIRVCVKPKPKFLTEKMWLKLASKFIYLEKTQPSISAIKGVFRGSDE